MKNKLGIYMNLNVFENRATDSTLLTKAFPIFFLITVS